MTLAVIAYPVFQELDQRWIEALRARLDPQASRIRAHFTLVFPVEIPDRNSQFVASGAQSAETFKDTATSDNIATDTAEPGMDIVLSVRNTSGTAQDFHGTLFGDEVE